jgi:hypothetical protein
MTDPDMPIHEKLLYAAFGNLIVEWNRTERSVSSLVGFFVHPTTDHPDADHRRRGHLALKIIMSEVGVYMVVNALRCIADTLEPSQKVAADCIAEWYDRLRDYRNYYVHGISNVAPSGDDNVATGIIFATSARRELVEDRDFVSPKQLFEAAQSAAALRTYIGEVLNHLAWEPGDPLVADRPRLPEPPQMPDKLKKRRSYLLRS